MRIKKFLFSKPFFPEHEKNLMANEGDVAHARDLFLKDRFNNLNYLHKKRYEWMNDYLMDGMKIVEIGCGAGFSQLYLSHDVMLTDAIENPWVEKKVDATDMDFSDSSIDVIIASHAIHHFYNPSKFFKECRRVLKDNGLILICEVNTSLLMRIIIKTMKQEGYSYDVDVFNDESICNDKNDLWSGNNAIPEMLFEDEGKFSEFFKGLKIEYQKFDEFTIFPLSGGVVSKIKMIELPSWVLKIFDALDKILIFLSPSIFALGRYIVIRKIS